MKLGRKLPTRMPAQQKAENKRHGKVYVSVTQFYFINVVTVFQQYAGVIFPFV